MQRSNILLIYYSIILFSFSVVPIPLAHSSMLILEPSAPQMQFEHSFLEFLIVESHYFEILIDDEMLFDVKLELGFNLLVIYSKNIFNSLPRIKPIPPYR